MEERTNNPAARLYRSMYLLACAASGQFARALADEGGMPSVLWAGPLAPGPRRMTLAFATDELETRPDVIDRTYLNVN